MARTNNDKRFLIGGIFLLLGLGVLLGNLEIFEYSVERVLLSWPMLTFLIGIIVYFSSDKKTISYALMGVGGLFLLFRIFDLPYGLHTIFWPAIFITIGAVLIFGKDVIKNFKRPIESRITDSDMIDEVVIFGGSERFYSSKNFKGGKISAIFGGAEINLLEADLAEGNNVLDVAFIFGGGSIIVPSDWKVRVEVVSIFGGFSDKRRETTSYIVSPHKELVIKGACIFGGGEIKSYK